MPRTEHFAIYVQNPHGVIHFVGKRSTMADAEETAAIYNRDPLAQGYFFAADTRIVRSFAAERRAALDAL